MLSSSRGSHGRKDPHQPVRGQSVGNHLRGCGGDPGMGTPLGKGRASPARAEPPERKRLWADERVPRVKTRFSSKTQDHGHRSRAAWRDGAGRDPEASARGKGWRGWRAQRPRTKAIPAGGGRSARQDGDREAGFRFPRASDAGRNDAAGEVNATHLNAPPESPRRHAHHAKLNMLCTEMGKLSWQRKDLKKESIQEYLTKALLSSKRATAGSV